ncbi:hypothetical protein KKC1_04920 [Calderihabitans maritimus]|uniref:Uncharacterized protein n=1 Tax=Calderihabitans maritimus TaxID=1246530 RepID=A0A1Z5HPX3_9FIRM|nr:hypothetical protein KKC1_04920 [Calderihabitans maritimus]
MACPHFKICRRTPYSLSQGKLNAIDDFAIFSEISNTHL